MDIDFLDDLPKILSISKKEEIKNYIDSYDNLMEIPNERERDLTLKNNSFQDEILVESEFLTETPIKINEEKKIQNNEIQKEPPTHTFSHIVPEIKISKEDSKKDILFIKVVRTAVLTLLISILLLLFFC